MYPRLRNEFPEPQKQEAICNDHDHRPETSGFTNSKPTQAQRPPCDARPTKLRIRSQSRHTNHAAAPVQTDLRLRSQSSHSESTNLRIYQFESNTGPRPACGGRNRIRGYEANPAAPSRPNLRNYQFEANTGLGPAPAAGIGFATTKPIRPLRVGPTCGITNSKPTQAPRPACGSRNRICDYGANPAPESAQPADLPIRSQRRHPKPPCHRAHTDLTIRS